VDLVIGDQIAIEIKGADLFQEKMLSGLKALKEENIRLEVNIAATGKIGEINQLHAVAESNFAKAKKTLAEVTESADKIKAEAKEYYDRQYALIADKEEEIKITKIRAEEALSEAKAWHKTNNLSLEAALKDVSKQQEELVIKQKEVDERLKKLKAVMN
jgi:hypothetical protein